MSSYGSTSSLEGHLLEYAFIHPLKASLLSMRSCDHGLDEERSLDDTAFVRPNPGRRPSRPLNSFNRTDRRKSVSTPAISRLVPSSYLHSPGNSIPENRLFHQTSLRARSCSPLGRPRGTVGSKGRLSDGSSFGDLMNSGDFRTRGSSIRCCSPIALSMVKSENRSMESVCHQRLAQFPTIAVDSPKGSPCISPAISRNFILNEESEYSSLGSQNAAVDEMEAWNAVMRPSFLREDGSVCCQELDDEQKKELHAYLTYMQKILTQRAMVMFRCYGLIV